MTTQHPQPQEQAQSGSGKPVIVDVVASLNPMGSVVFDHEWRFQDAPTKSKGRIEIPKAQPSDPGTPIHFHLHDDSGRNLRFHQDPIWVTRSQCPNQSSEDSEIPRDQFDTQPKLLKVLNKNNEECELHYNLRFQDERGQIEEYDPSIRNGGR